MTLYLAIYCFSLLIYIFSYEKSFKNLNNCILGILFSVILICIAGFRYNISTDYWSYYRIFIGTADSLDRMEWGFKSIINASKKLFGINTFNAFIFLIAFISISIKGIYMSKLKNPFLAFFMYICIYFFDSDFNIIRQGLGIGFIWFAIKEGEKKHFLKFLFLTILASLFHIIYLIFIPLYFLCAKTYTLNIKKLIYFIILILVFRITCFDLILSIIQGILKTSGNVFILQLCNYLGVGDFSLNFSILRRLAFLILYLLIFKPDKIDCYFIFYFISFLVSILLAGNEQFSHRLSLCFDIFSVPLFANQSIKLTKKNIIYILALLLSLTVLYFKPMQVVLPYQTYL